MRDLLFEAFYAGGNAQHADLTLRDNTLYGPMWWEHVDIWDPTYQKDEGLLPALSVSPLNPQPSTLNPQPSTLNPQHSTLNTQPSTLNLEP